jgi:hypothetical protein
MKKLGAVLALMAAPMTVEAGTQEKHSGIANDHVHRMEANFVYDDNGKETLRQMIYWVLTHDGQEKVRDWRLLKECRQIPVKNHTTDLHETIWFDGDTLRRVTSDLFNESHTQFDPEVYDRNVHPMDKRRKLSK